MPGWVPVIGPEATGPNISPPASKLYFLALQLVLSLSHCLPGAHLDLWTALSSSPVSLLLTWTVCALMWPGSELPKVFTPYRYGGPMPTLLYALVTVWAPS